MGKSVGEYMQDDFGENGMFYDSEAAPFSRRRSNVNVISETDLRAFLKCPHGYYLKKHVGASKVPRSGFPAIAMFFENARRSLFRPRGSILPFQTRGGPQLKKFEEMDKEELKQFLATGEGKFGNLLSGTWLAIAEKQEYAGAQLVWSFEHQRFSGASQLKKAGNNYYGFVLDNGAPVQGYMNKDMTFKFKGHVLKVKFPELRKGMFIDDISLWNFNCVSPDEGGVDISDSTLVTLRTLAYCTLAAETSFYRKKWGVDPQVADKWAKRRPSIGREATYRHFNATEGVTVTTHRTSKHLDLLEKLIDRHLEGVSREEFAPNRKGCGVCPYNCVGSNGKVICGERASRIKPSVPIYYLQQDKDKNMKNLQIEVDKSKRGLIELVGRVSKNETVTKEVARFRLVCREEKGDEGQESEKIRVDSHYDLARLDIRGLGYEMQMISEADRQLQALADDTGKLVTHFLNYDRDFDCAGKIKISKRLLELGYVGGYKTYEPGD